MDLSTFDQLLSYLTNRRPAIRQLTVLRDDQPMDITVTLGERP
jgi:hypothetical protein